MKVLVINPGSTSTKIAIFRDRELIHKRNISHSTEELKQFATIIDQFEYRKTMVLEELAHTQIELDFDAVIGRGGLTKPLAGGVYEVNEAMIADIKASVHNHASDLGCIIAASIADDIPSCKKFIADPVIVDELCDYARVSGCPLLPRISIWHALNQKAIARRFAKGNGKKYEDLNLIVCHLGGGISIAAHNHGKAVDVNNALDGEGPFAPERAGSLPAADLIRLCFSGRFTQEELLKQVSGNAGLAAHLGSNDMREIENRVNSGDERAKFLVDAMIYHISKDIASKGAVLYGKVDAILITGGIAHWTYVVDEIRKRVEYLAGVYVFPGEDEMQALADNALAVLNGERQVKVFE